MTRKERLSPVLPFTDQRACLQLPYCPSFLPSLDLSRWSLRLWQVTSLSKDFMKQDIVLLINFYALTNQPLTCHTCRFVKKPRQTSMFRLPLYEYSEVSHSKWTADKAKIPLFNIHICCYTMYWPQTQISMFTQGKTALRKHTEWWRNKVCAVNITLSITIQKPRMEGQCKKHAATEIPLGLLNKSVPNNATSTYLICKKPVT